MTEQSAPSESPQRIRKGQLVAIKQIHRDFHIGEGTVVWEHWAIGCVWKTNRAGQITHVSTSVDPPTSRPNDLSSVVRYAGVRLIPDEYEEAARYVASKQFDKEWWPLFKERETLAAKIKAIKAEMDRGAAAAA